MPPSDQYRVMTAEEVAAVTFVATANANKAASKGPTKPLTQLIDSEFKKMTGADRVADLPDGQIMNTANEASVQQALVQHQAHLKQTAREQPKPYNRRANDVEELAIKDELQRRFDQQFAGQDVSKEDRKKFIDQEKEKITGFPTLPIPYTTISTDKESEDRVKAITEGFVHRELNKIRDENKQMIRDPFQMRPDQTAQAPDDRAVKRSV